MTQRGRAYFDRKVIEGKTKKEALGSLTRQISNTVYRQMLSDADRTTEQPHERAWAGTPQKRLCRPA